MFSDIDNKIILADFGNKMKEARERAGLFQTEIADMLDLSQNYYSDIENGKKNLPFSTVVKICAILNIDLNDFVEQYR